MTVHEWAGFRLQRCSPFLFQFHVIPVDKPTPRRTFLLFPTFWMRIEGLFRSPIYTLEKGFHQGGSFQIGIIQPIYYVVKSLLMHGALPFPWFPDFEVPWWRFVWMYMPTGPRKVVLCASVWKEIFLLLNRSSWGVYSFGTRDPNRYDGFLTRSWKLFHWTQSQLWKSTLRNSTIALIN